MSDNKSSSVLALNNFMSKLHDAPIYECLHKFGKSHKPYFKYICKAMGDEVIGTGRSKRDAKNLVARLMLEQLSRRGYMVPPEFQNPESMSMIMERAGIPTRSFVVLLHELCQQYHLDPVEYEVVMTSEEPIVTVKARIGHVQRIASASSKRMATQLAAEQIYKHLRTRLSGTRSFNEEEAIVRAYERAMAPTQDEAAALVRSQDDEEGEASGQQSEQEKQNAAIEATRRLEQEDMDQDGSIPSTSRQSEEDARNAAISAMSFIERTMERLGL